MNSRSWGTACCTCWKVTTTCKWMTCWLAEKNAQQAPPWPITDHNITAPPAIRACLDQPSPATAMAKVRVDMIGPSDVNTSCLLPLVPVGQIPRRNALQNAWCMQVVSNLEFFSLRTTSMTWKWLKHKQIVCANIRWAFQTYMFTSTWLIPMHSAGKMFTILVGFFNYRFGKSSKRTLFLREGDHDWNMKSPQFPWW